MRITALPSMNVLGTKVAAWDLNSAVDQIDQWISCGAKGKYICVTGVHGVMEGLRRPDVRQSHNSADACVPDGMPIVWVGRLRGHQKINRVYGPDLMLSLLGHSVKKGYSSYFYGGDVGVADDLKRKMQFRFDGLQAVGSHTPPFRPLNLQEKAQLISEVHEKSPNIFWVGLSTPKQELFMHEYCRELNTNVMIGVGAAFDFHTGRVRQAPRWMMAAGLEWLFRLCLEPRRLGPRYLRNNPAFIWHISLQLSGIRKYPIY